MSLAETLIAELTHEAISTRKALARVPSDQFDWVPHERSMTLGRLASHVAELPSWALMILRGDKFIIEPATFKAFSANSPEQLVKTFDTNVVEACTALKSASDDYLSQLWSLKTPEKTLLEMPRDAVLRSWIMNHFVHHRGQLTVYLRLLNVPIPPIYGSSADEKSVRPSDSIYGPVADKHVR